MRIKILHFVKDKETKRMVRYAEQPLPGTEAIIPYLYVSKTFAGPAQWVVVKIEVEDTPSVSAASSADRSSER